MQIIPSLFVSDKKSFQKQLTGLGTSVNIIQIDIADGDFVDATTWSHNHAEEIQALLPFNLQVELHLMVRNPLEELKKWQKIEQVIRILVHYESVQNLHDILPTLHAYGWEIGIAINPNTPLWVLDPYLKEIKTVLFMGVMPGKQGQEFDASILQKIIDLRARGDNHFIEIDGGVNENTIPDILDAGADAICPGSAIFGNRRKPASNVATLQKLIHKLTQSK